MNDRIVVGVDQSTPSRAALAWAVDRAALVGCGLTILHVIDHEFDGTADESQSFARMKASDFLEEELEFARDRQPHLHVTAELMRGEPFAALVSASLTADLLVLGTHKTGFIHGRATGSRFLGLTIMAQCPVVFIPNSGSGRRTGVVVAVEDSATGRQAVRYAAAEADRSGHELSLVFSTQWRESPGEDAESRAQRELHALERASTVLGGATTIARELNPRLDVRTRVSRRPLAQELIDASSSARLVVIGHAQDRVPLGSPMGVVVHDVLMNLGGPIVVIANGEADRQRDEHLASLFGFPAWTTARPATRSQPLETP